MMIILVMVLVVVNTMIWWKLFGEQTKEIINKQIENLMMRRAIKTIESKSYYEIDDVLEVRMNFNKKFWGNKRFVCPRIIKRYIGKYFYDYIIRFE